MPFEGKCQKLVTNANATVVGAPTYADGRWKAPPFAAGALPAFPTTG